MKNPFLLIGAIILIVLGAVSFAQWQAANALKQELAALRASAESKADELARAQAELGELRKKAAGQKEVIGQLENRNKEIASSNPGGNGAPGKERRRRAKREKKVSATSERWSERCSTTRT
jgi:uncharacterized protein involved in exopolysaccharide biosynthesis